MSEERQERVLNNNTSQQQRIKGYDLEINHLHDLVKLGMLRDADAAIIVEDMKNKQFELKEKMVLERHNNKITETSVVERGKKVKKWQTRCQNGQRPRRSSYGALIEYLYDIYFGEPLPNKKKIYSFEAVFEAAVQEKIATEQPKEKTIRDYRSTYKAFIPADLAKKDVRDIKPSEIKAFLQMTTQKFNPGKKRLYKLKGILNLVFDYATDPERLYITVNPVPHNNRAYVKNCKPASHNPEDKAFQPDDIKKIRSYLWKRVENRSYDVNGYAILFSSETGVREAEIPSLKWTDISEDKIHIHSQQNDEMRDGKKEYYYNPSTKDEKGISRGGRYLPMTQPVRKILNELKEKQTALGIETDWVFAKLDGTWMTTQQYYEALYKVSKKLELKLSNNHAFRMSLNSYVLIPAGFTVTERARMLGHSVETNLKNYSFAQADDGIAEMGSRWDKFNDEQLENKQNEMSTPSTSKIITFSRQQKKPAIG